MQSITRREAIKKSGRLLWGAAACSLLQGLSMGCSSREIDPAVVSRVMQNTREAAVADIRLTVVYDNLSYRNDLRRDWGFSCLIEGLDKTVIFDSGRYDNIIMTNLATLHIDPQQIDVLFLSHDHPDHVGGALKLLEMNSTMQVSLVKAFPSGFKRLVTSTGATLAAVDQPHGVSRHCLSTGEMKSVVKNEHALVLLTDRGSIIVTGCAHPGVVEIVERTIAITNREVLLLVGGFHLLMDHAASIRKIAARLQELGVQYVAPSHCTGAEATKILAEVYGERFVRSGLGRVITADNLV